MSIVILAIIAAIIALSIYGAAISILGLVRELYRPAPPADVEPEFMGWVE